MVMGTTKKYIVAKELTGNETQLHGHMKPIPAHLVVELR